MEEIKNKAELMEGKFFVDISDRQSWLCDPKATLRQGDMVVVLYENRLVGSGKVLNRFPNIKRRLRLECFDHDGQRHVTRTWTRYPGRGWVVAAVEGIHTSYLDRLNVKRQK